MDGRQRHCYSRTATFAVVVCLPAGPNFLQLFQPGDNDANLSSFAHSLLLYYHAKVSVGSIWGFNDTIFCLIVRYQKEYSTKMGVTASAVFQLLCYCEYPCSLLSSGLVFCLIIVRCEAQSYNTQLFLLQWIVCVVSYAFLLECIEQYFLLQKDNF